MIKRRLVIELQTEKDLNVFKAFKAKCALLNRTIRGQMLKLMETFTQEKKIK